MLGPTLAIAIVVGNVIGTGIFMKPGQAAASAGQFSTVMWAWVAGGVVCVLGGLCFAELAVLLPKAGGLYVYLKEAYGKTVAYLFGWSEFVFGRPASIGAYSIGLVSAVEIIVLPARQRFSIWEAVGISAIAIAVMATINIKGTLWGGSVQGLSTLVKCAILVLLGALPIVLMAGGYVGVRAENYSSTVAPSMSSFSGQFAGALLAVMWAYNGWHGVCPVAEEIRNPRRNIPLALFAGLGIIILLYLGMNAVYFGCLTMEQVKEAGFQLPQVLASTLLSPVSESLAKFVSGAISLSIIISMLGGININLMNGPRVALAVGREEPGLRALSSVNPTRHTPTVAIAFQAFMSIALISAVAGYISWKQHEEYSGVFYMLTDYVVFSASIFYLLTVGSVIVLRVRRPDAERAFSTPAYPWIPLLYLLVNVWFLYEIFAGSWGKAIKERVEAGESVAWYESLFTWHEATVSISLSLAGLPVLWLARWYGRSLSRDQSAA